MNIKSPDTLLRPDVVNIQEFYEPLKRNGLLTDDQLQTIFLNLDELIMINKYFVEKLENVIKVTRQKSDEVST